MAKATRLLITMAAAASAAACVSTSPPQTPLRPPLRCAAKEPLPPAAQVEWAGFGVVERLRVKRDFNIPGGGMTEGRARVRILSPILGEPPRAAWVSYILTWTDFDMNGHAPELGEGIVVWKLRQSRELRDLTDGCVAGFTRPAAGL